MAQLIRAVGPDALAPNREGLLYTPGHGLAAFTVPQFDEFLRRTYTFDRSDDPLTERASVSQMSIAALQIATRSAHTGSSYRQRPARSVDPSLNVLAQLKVGARSHTASTASRSNPRSRAIIVDRTDAPGRVAAKTPAYRGYTSA